MFRAYLTDVARRPRLSPPEERAITVELRDSGVVPVAGEIEVAVPIAPSGFSGVQRKETADEGHCQKRELRGRENAAASPGGGRAARLASVRRQRGHESAGGDARGGAGAALRPAVPARSGADVLACGLRARRAGDGRPTRVGATASCA